MSEILCCCSCSLLWGGVVCVFSFRCVDSKDTHQASASELFPCWFLVFMMFPNYFLFYVSYRFSLTLSLSLLHSIKHNDTYTRNKRWHARAHAQQSNKKTTSNKKKKKTECSENVWSHLNCSIHTHIFNTQQICTYVHNENERHKHYTNDHTWKWTHWYQCGKNAENSLFLLVNGPIGSVSVIQIVIHTFERCGKWISGGQQISLVTTSIRMLMTAATIANTTAHYAMMHWRTTTTQYSSNCLQHKWHSLFWSSRFRFVSFSFVRFGLRMILKMLIWIDFKSI